ncbi:hypothetical protein QTP86_033563, partial [Hemibagrus guttatus]
RPVTLTAVVMKSFDHLVLSYLKDITDPLLDPLQFAYRSNRSVDDAVNMALHFILQHLDSPGSYARILFVDFSSAFNTIIPALLRDKLFQLNVPDSMCSWITDFLTDRRQFVRLGTHVSDLQHISTGPPQGCVLSPLLFSLYTNGCTFGHQSVKLLKFADNTTLIISDGDESAYRGEIDRLVSWCSMNNLELNSLKTVEMTVDFRKNPAPRPPVILCDSPVSSAESFCFLGTTITKELKWEQNIRSLTKKAQQKFLLPVKMLVNFYTAIIESEEKEQLQQKLRKTEGDLTRQLNYTQQTLSEKSRELDKLRSEWTSQTSTMSSRHTQDLTAEREKALEIQTRLQQQNDQLRRELEATHQRSTQQLQTRLAELETSNRELTEKKYKSDSTIRDLKAKLLGLEEVGCELEEKERFWSELDEVMESIPTGERVVIGADFNGHVGEGNPGDEEGMGKFGVKERNLEGQMVVDFAKRMDMAVVNTYFQKREEHRVTYKSGGRRTQVDYILCRRGNLKEISDCKVVVGESVARQHRMVVCRMTLMVCKTKRSKIEKKTKWWKLKKEECCEEFRQKLRQALGGQVVLPDDWETTAEVIRETGRKVQGVSSGRRKEDKETWWWNEEVQDSIQRKRLAKKKWDMDRTEENRQEYKELQRRVKREVSKAKQKAYDELYTRLDTREGEKDLYRLARQRDQDGKDVQQYRDGQRELHCVFVDLEKAYDRVPREELWYCMRKSGVAEKYVRVVQDMYERSRTAVRCAVGQTEEFNVEVGLHQGSALSPFLFAIVMDQLSEEVRQESPWTMMFADDIVICSESREQVEENLERWRFALERRGMKVSRSKTEYMCVNEREGSGTVRLQGEEVKKVQEFKYLGSTVQSNGECGKEVKKRVQAGWNGWRKVSGVLCDQKISARIKGKVYRTVVRPAMLYGLETVSLRKRQESELEESQRMKQQVTSLRRENGTLDTECHEKERLVNQLQTRVAVLEQEIKDKDQLILRTKEVLEATQQQKTSVEETAECKQLQIGRLESTVKSLSEELIKANGIIKKLQGDLKALVGKIKVKNTVTVSQEKVLQETTDRLQREQRELQDTQHRLRLKEDEVSKLQEQLESTVKKLDESKEVLKTNENVITWLNKQLNENQLSRKQDTVGVFETPQPGAGLRLAPASHNMLESKTFSSLGQPYPVTSTLNSKHSFPLSCVSAGPHSVLTLHNPNPGPKAGSFFFPILLILFTLFLSFASDWHVQFNPMSAKASMSPVQGNGNPAALQSSSNKENGEPLGLDSKYFERRDESIPLRGLVPSMHLNKEIAKPSSNMVNAKPTAPSAYFPV